MNKTIAITIALWPFWAAATIINVASDWYNPDLGSLIHVLTIVVVVVYSLSFGLIALISYCTRLYDRLIQKKPSPQPDFPDLQTKADRMDVGDLLEKHRKDISR